MTRNELMIRDALPEDALLLSAGEDAVAQTPGLLNAAPGEIPVSAYRDKIIALRGHPHGLYIVAVQDQEIVGHLLLDPLPLAANAHICALTIVVYPESQGAGVGRQLLEHAIVWAGGVSGVEKIELRVREGNHRAIALYRACGFEQEGVIRKRVKTADGYLDDLAMGLWLPHSE